MQYRGIVFDKDGTLLDFHQTWLPVYRFAAEEFSAGNRQMAAQMLEQHGFDVINQRFHGGSLLAAGNNRQIAEHWADQAGQTDATEQWAARLHAIFRDQGAEHATPVAHLATTLIRLKQAGLKLGVATADSYDGIINTLQSFDVLHEFEFLAGYDSGYGVKPGGGMVRAFCEQMNLSANTVVVVGDNHHDIEMGRNAKAGLCVGVLTGTSTRSDLETSADIVLDDISALPDLLIGDDR